MKPVDTVEFWKDRLTMAQANKRLHHAVYVCDLDKWVRIAENHKKVLAKYVLNGASVLDVGCAYGRLVDMLPPDEGPRRKYLGVDLSPDLIQVARQRYPDHLFRCGTIEDISETLQPQEYDVAVLISIKGMVLRELGFMRWQSMQSAIERVTKSQLYLEYDEDDPGVFVRSGASDEDQSK